MLDEKDITIDMPNIVDQLESKGKTWKAYMQSYSLCSTPLDDACGDQLYERKHNPFITYKDVRTKAARVANIVYFSQFATDLASNTVADDVWITRTRATTCTEGVRTPADPCDFSQVPALIETADSFLLHSGERDHDVEGGDGEFGDLYRVGGERFHGHGSVRVWRHQRLLRR